MGIIKDIKNNIIDINIAIHISEHGENMKDKVKSSK